MLDSSTAQMFDIALNRPRTSSSIRRKQTKLVEETVLSQTNGAQCVVTNMNQYFTSMIGGYNASQTQMITIETYPMKWQVKRLDSDFDTLREYLLRSYPQTIIPPLPNPTKKKMTYNQTTKRMIHYTRFLNCCLKSQILRTSKFLVAFLQETNQDVFNVKLLTVEDDKGPKNIYDFRTLSGEIEIEQR